jgi:hypothetical protein
MLIVTITHRIEHIEVEVTTDAVGVDRKAVTGWWLKPSHGALAERLSRAIKAGVVLTNPVVKTDIAGKTYLSTENQVLARNLNADLKRLGF